MCRFSPGLGMFLNGYFAFCGSLSSWPYTAPYLLLTLPGSFSMLRYIPGMLVVHHPEQQGSSSAFLNRADGGGAMGSVRRAARGTCAVVDGAAGVGCGLQCGKYRLGWLVKGGLSVCCFLSGRVYGRACIIEVRSIVRRTSMRACVCGLGGGRRKRMSMFIVGRRKRGGGE